MLPARLAAGWSLVFLLPHVYWAAGGRAGLDGRAMEGALMAVNYAAVLLSAAAFAVALALARPAPPRAAVAAAWAAAVVLGLRGIAGVGAGVIALATGDGDWPLFVAVFEALFCLGGLAFALAARAAGAGPRRHGRLRRSPRPSPV